LARKKPQTFWVCGFFYAKQGYNHLNVLTFTYNYAIIYTVKPHPEA